MKLKDITVKTGFANTSIPKVQPVDSIKKTKTSTEKWKENLYFEEEKLSEEEVTAVSEELLNNKSEEYLVSAQELYEREMNTYNPRRDELLGKMR